MNANITRRKFLIASAAGLGAVTLACGGLTAAAVHAPIDPSFSIYAVGKIPMDQKVLVTYASRAGSTMEIAQAVGEDLSKRGFVVDIIPVKQVNAISDYSRVVIGTAVRMGAPLPEVKKFVEKNSKALNNMPSAIFAVHLQNTGDDEVSRKARFAYLDPVRSLVSFQAEAFFVGVYDKTKVSFIEGLMGNYVKTPVGDFRDWSAISNWSQTIFA